MVSPGNMLGSFCIVQRQQNWLVPIVYRKEKYAISISIPRQRKKNEANSIDWFGKYGIEKVRRGANKPNWNIYQNFNKHEIKPFNERVYIVTNWAERRKRKKIYIHTRSAYAIPSNKTARPYHHSYRIFVILFHFVHFSFRFLYLLSFRLVYWNYNFIFDTVHRAISCDVLHLITQPD